MNYLALACLVAACLSMQGCLVTSIFGADYHVQVNNHTDDTIRVKAGGDWFGDAGWFDTQSKSIPSGGNDQFIIDGFEPHPEIRVQYKDQTRSFDVDEWAFGYETMDIETHMFVNGNG